MKTINQSGTANLLVQHAGRNLLLAVAASLCSFDAMAAPQVAVNLGTAANFAVLAGPSISSTSGGTINGNIGTSPGSTFVPGTPAVLVIGTIHLADAVALQAQNDLITAYNDAALRPLPALVAGGALGGLTLAPGLYKDDGAPVSLGLTGTLTLDAQGDPNAVWIFQSASTLIAESGSRVVLINGAEACNVFWQVGSSASLRTGAAFAGNIMALSAITLETLATLDGRVLARNAGVTLDNNTVGIAACGAASLTGVPSNTAIACDAVIPAPPVVTAGNACSTQTTVTVLSEDILPGACVNTYTLRRIWSGIDSCGISVSATQLIEVADLAAPTIINCAPPVTVQCASDVPAPDTNLVTAVDTCGGVRISHVGDSLLTDACGGTITRTYRATDECGNFTDCTQLITVNDITVPQITCPASPVMVAGNGTCQGIVPDLTALLEATDNCGSVGLVVTQVPPGGTPFTEQTNVTLTATDQCGRSNVCVVAVRTPCAPGFRIGKILTNVYFEASTTNQRPPRVGEAVSFLITIVNTGDVTMLVVPVVDLYDTNLLRYVGARPPSDDNLNDGVINWTNVGPLAVGATTTLVVNFIGECATTSSLVRTGTNLVVALPTPPRGAPPILPLTNGAPYEIAYGFLGDSVWIDLNGNTLPDENLATYGINGVTVRLYELVAGITNYLAMTTTATDLTTGRRGQYLFEGLPLGDYLVRVDVTTLPPKLVVNTTPVAINLLAQLTPCGLLYEADFGFLQAAPTVVDLVDFRAEADGGRVRLIWQTLSERNNAGYNLYFAATPDGERTRINDALIPGSEDGSGRTYTYDDPVARGDGDSYYWIEDVEYDHSVRSHGPVRVTTGQGADAVTLIGATAAAKPGLYTLTPATFRRSQLNPLSVDPNRLRVYVDGAEVAAYVTTAASVFSAWDYALFYVQSPGRVSFGYEAGAPLRMASRFVFLEPGDGGLWAGRVEDEAAGLHIALSREHLRYLATGFHESMIWLLDISNADAPALLLGADMIQVGDETGAYFSDATRSEGTVFATGAGAIIEIESIHP